MTDVLAGVSVISALDREGEDLRSGATDRLAASLVRRLTMPHDPGCRDDCLHRNHRRDRAHLDLILSMLGRDDVAAAPEDYESALDWASMSKAEAAYMKGSPGGTL